MNKKITIATIAAASTSVYILACSAFPGIMPGGTFVMDVAFNIADTLGFVETIVG